MASRSAIVCRSPTQCVPEIVVLHISPNRNKKRETEGLLFCFMREDELGSTRYKWRHAMREVYGIGDFRYEYVDGWVKLPEGVTFRECPGVAVDAQDNVYVLTRGEQPIMVFDREGNHLRSFGQGYFSNRTHGLYIAHDSSLLVADDGIHTIQKFNTDGDQLMEIGNRNAPADKWSGEPFNRPTSAAIMPSNGDVYVSDGYGMIAADHGVRSRRKPPPLLRTGLL